MDYSKDRKWAIVSQITSWGWILAALVTAKKKHSRFLACWLNNGFLFFLFGILVSIILESIRKFQDDIVYEGIGILLDYCATVIFDIVGILYLVMLAIGLFYVIRGEEKVFPYFFRIGLFDKLMIFKASDEEPTDTTSYNTESHDLKGAATKNASDNPFCRVVHNTGAYESSIVSRKPLHDEKTCPICGRTVGIEDVICTYCGTRIEPVEDSDKNKTSERMTVFDYIRSLKEYKCENCGEMVISNDRFCPNCGKEIIIKANPTSCKKCGNQVSSGFTFCPKCGEEIKPILLQTNCKKCGAELIYGKDFCVNCGTKVNEIEIDTSED